MFCVLPVCAGTWRVTLQPVEAGGPYNVTAVTHNATATLTDVLFGDVWLCGGQSNMYFKMSQVRQRQVKACVCACVHVCNASLSARYLTLQRS